MTEYCEIKSENLEINSKDFKYYEGVAEDYFSKWTEKTKDSEGQEKLKLDFWKFHHFVAVKSLFPKYQNLQDLESDVPEEEIIDCGSVANKDEILSFEDENLRDYFIADYISKCLKNADVDHDLLKIFMKTLIDQNHETIRRFINDALEDSTILIKIDNKMQKFINSFYKMNNFAEYFLNNLENLVDLIISMVKNGEHKKAKKIVDKNAISNACETTYPKMFSKLQEFLFEFYNNDELKKIVKSKDDWTGPMLHDSIYKTYQVHTFKNLWEIYRKVLTDHELLEIVGMKGDYYENVLHTAGRCSADEVFVFVLEELDKIPFKDEIRKILSSLGDCKQNLLQSASYSLHNLESHDIIWKIYPKYFSKSEMLDFINYINDHDNNLLFDLINNTSENAEFIWNQMKQFMTHEEQVKSLESKRCGGQNILERTYHNVDPSEIRKWVRGVLKEYEIDIPDSEEQDIEKDIIFKTCEAEDPDVITESQDHLFDVYSIEELKILLKSKNYQKRTMLHESVYNSVKLLNFQNLWNIYRKTLTDHELLELLAMKDDYHGDVLHIAGRCLSDEIFVFILEELDKIPIKDEVKKILSSLGDCKQNLLQSTSYSLQNLESHKVIWKIYPKYFNSTEMLALINHINDHDNNLLFDLINNTKENAEFIWNQMKTFMTHEEQVECLKTKRCYDQNIIERTYHNMDPDEIRKWVEDVLKEYKIPIPKDSQDF